MYTAKLWDLETPINGVPAEEVKAIHNYTSGAVGLVLDEDGAAVTFQYIPGIVYDEERALKMVEEEAAQRNNLAAEQPKDQGMEGLKDKVDEQDQTIAQLLLMLAEMKGAE